MLQVKVILNPYADNGHGRQKIEVVKAAARPYGGVDLALTERPQHGIDLARQAAEAGYDVVAAAGGDGTVSDVMNGLMQAQNPAVRLGIIPVGSGNDL
ncbi:MAG TPA: diacylglycerol kinase family lipid kinase, partial [Chloroflexi bacterium]|nr:diacylglycerol kinase family lipid kinase [Chloroflexota bacterium]